MGPFYLRGATIAERLEFYSIPEPNSGCRLWLGGLDGVGYGQVWTGPETGRRGAHVCAWEEANGRPVPPGMLICHKCDVRPCIEAEHLFLGTYTDNVRDMFAKGRANTARPRGEENKNSKLTAEIVARIRADDRNPKIIAGDYGVHWSVIYHVRQRRKWAHVP